MRHAFRWCAIAVLSVCAAACGDLPSAPTAAEPPARPPASAPPPATMPPDPGPMGHASGTVVDTEGRPVAGAHISGTGVDAYSDAGGAFAFSFPMTISAVRFDAEGMESGSRAWMAGQSDVTLRVVLQRTFVVSVGGRVTIDLTSNDLPYYVGEAYDSEYCKPCKLVRISGLSGTDRARVTLSWGASDDPGLQLWASDGYSVTPAKSGETGTRVVEVGARDSIYAGLPLGVSRHPQQLTKAVRFELRVQ